MYAALDSLKKSKIHVFFKRYFADFTIRGKIGG